ncbi:MAG: hypothetical protein EON87_01045 [Brevundimonas sp.]|nr:MAG: hypothetical protein EON87_01045 [Brevundimonas sp.]
MGFVHDEDYGTPDFGIEDIERCTDVETLREWLAETEDRHGDIEAQVEAALKCEHYDDAWMEKARGALGFAGMGLRKLRRRLLALGVNPTPEAPKDELRALQIGLQKSKAATAKAQQGAAFGRHLLAALTDALPKPTVEAICHEAARRATADAPDQCEAA